MAITFNNRILSNFKGILAGRRDPTTVAVPIEWLLSSAGTSLGETGRGAASWLLSSVLDDCSSCVEWYVVICLGGLEKGWRR